MSTRRSSSKPPLGAPLRAAPWGSRPGRLLVRCLPLVLALGLCATAAEAGASRSAPSSHELWRKLQGIERRVRQAGFNDALVAEPLAESRRALERARGARAAGDRRHGALLERLAAEWAGAAASTLRAARAERRARQQAERAQELATRLERARALLAEQQARRGRLQAKLRRGRGLEQGPSGKAAGQAPARSRAAAPDPAGPPRAANEAGP